MGSAPVEERSEILRAHAEALLGSRDSSPSAGVGLARGLHLGVSSNDPRNDLDRWVTARACSMKLLFSKGFAMALMSQRAPATLAASRRPD